MRNERQPKQRFAVHTSASSQRQVGRRKNLPLKRYTNHSTRRKRRKRVVIYARLNGLTATHTNDRIMDGYHHARPCFGRLFRARKQVSTGQGNFPSRWRIRIKIISNENILHCVSPRSATIKRKVYAISADAQMNSNGPPFQHPQNLREGIFCINYYESNSSPLLYATEN